MYIYTYTYYIYIAFKSLHLLKTSTGYSVVTYIHQLFFLYIAFYILCWSKVFISLQYR